VGQNAGKSVVQLLVQPFEAKTILLRRADEQKASFHFKTAMKAGGAAAGANPRGRSPQRMNPSQPFQ